MPKIRRISFFKAVSTLSRPVADSTHSIPEIAFVVTRIKLDNGVTGVVLPVDGGVSIGF